MAKYHITQDDGKGGQKQTCTSKNGKYSVTTNNPEGITEADGTVVVGDNSKVVINHLPGGKTEVYKNGRRVS